MNQLSGVSYQREERLTAEEFVDILRRATLSERRPVEDRATIEGMLAHCDLLITARAGGQLVGISRAITDFSYCTYLSDLAVDVGYQRQGIGRELIRRTHEAAGSGRAANSKSQAPNHKQIPKTKFE